MSGERGMRALTLWQPWASLVACGAKKIETRSWGTPYRGPVLIHAALQKPPTTYNRERFVNGVRVTEPPEIDPRTVEEMIAGLGVADFDSLPRGAVVAVAEITQCEPALDDAAVQHALWRAIGPSREKVRREYVCGNFAPGRWMWLLWDVTPLPTPIEWPGQRRLWIPPDELVAQVRDALPAWQI